MATPILCSVRGCTNNMFCKGYCRSHYERHRKHGDPLAGRFVSESCSVEGCSGKHAAKGLCRKHYARLMRHGDPLVEFKTTPPGKALAWLLNHVCHASAECLAWPFSNYHGGYGHMRVNGEYTGAHRVMCQLAHGEPIGEKSQVAHSCGNPACVNPRHLRWATRQENEADKLIHGTDNRGAKHGMSKLTDDNVREIRALKGVMRQRDIAARFSIAQGTVSEIQAGKRWTHI